MTRKRSIMKGRADKNGGFSMLIHAYFQSPEYAELSPRAVKLLVDLYCQFRGKNNGDLCATLSVMKRVGWTSNDQLQKAIVELMAKGWLIIARQGGRRMPTLYALTFLAIDETKKLDPHIKANRPPAHLWKVAHRENVLLNATAQLLWNKMNLKKIPSYRPADSGSPLHGLEQGGAMMH